MFLFSIIVQVVLLIFSCYCNLVCSFRGNSFKLIDDHRLWKEVWLNCPMQRQQKVLISRYSMILLKSAVDDQKESWESDSLQRFISEREEITSDVETFEDDNDQSRQDYDAIFEEYNRWTKSVEKAVDNLEKKKQSLENELDKAEQLQMLQARGNLITTYMYMFSDGVTSGTVQDWEQEGSPEILLKLDPKYDSAAEEVNSIYSQVRKLKRGSQVIRPLLEATQMSLNTLRKLQSDLSSALPTKEDNLDYDIFRQVQKLLRDTSKKTNFVPPANDNDSIQKSSQTSKRSSTTKPELGSPASNVRKFKSKAGNIIYVGRNRRGNEYLSLNVAKGNDVWMHARGTPGAHVVVKSSRGGSSITDDCIQFAANLAAFYSDSRTERKAAVTAAEPKHVQKPRGAPLGAVKLREELFVRIGYPDDVPDELKEARDESGLGIEYRATDKAKLRKRNADIAKQQRSKNRSRASAECDD